MTPLKRHTMLLVLVASFGGLSCGDDIDSFGDAATWSRWFACTLAYLVFAAFFLPETKGRTLEEIEESFAGTSGSPEMSGQGAA